MKKRNVGNAAVLYLCSESAAFPGKTLGDIETALGVPRGTALHQRMTEKRQQGFPIKSHEVDGSWLYFIHRSDVARCLAMLAAKASRKAA